MTVRLRDALRHIRKAEQELDLAKDTLDVAATEKESQEIDEVKRRLRALDVRVRTIERRGV